MTLVLKFMFHLEMSTCISEVVFVHVWSNEKKSKLFYFFLWNLWFSEIFLWSSQEKRAFSRIFTGICFCTGCSFNPFLYIMINHQMRNKLHFMVVRALHRQSSRPVVNIIQDAQNLPPSDLALQRKSRPTARGGSLPDTAVWPHPPTPSFITLRDIVLKCSREELSKSKEFTICCDLHKKSRKWKLSHTLVLFCTARSFYHYVYTYVCACDKLFPIYHLNKHQLLSTIFYVTTYPHKRIVDVKTFQSLSWHFLLESKHWCMVIHQSCEIQWNLRVSNFSHLKTTLLTL